jgi:predicted enzyme related to lactoylglutathione lyase
MRSRRGNGGRPRAPEAARAALAHARAADALWLVRIGVRSTTLPTGRSSPPVAAHIVSSVGNPQLSSIEFPADDPERARRFWTGLLGAPLEARRDAEGDGWQTRAAGPTIGVHVRGRGPGDSFSLPYFAVADLAAALDQVRALGGTIVHPGTSWAICKDSEGSPFGLATR